MRFAWQKNHVIWLTHSVLASTMAVPNGRLAGLLVIVNYLFVVTYFPCVVYYHHAFLKDSTFFGHCKDKPDPKPYVPTALEDEHKDQGTSCLNRAPSTPPSSTGFVLVSLRLFLPLQLLCLSETPWIVCAWQPCIFGDGTCPRCRSRGLFHPRRQRAALHGAADR